KPATVSAAQGHLPRLDLTPEEAADITSRATAEGVAPQEALKWAAEEKRTKGALAPVTAAGPRVTNLSGQTDAHDAQHVEAVAAPKNAGTDAFRINVREFQRAGEAPTIQD